MNILRKFTLKDIKLNRKRTIGTLTGIILSCALIIVVLGMLITLYNSIFLSEVYNNGYYHVRIGNLSKEEIKEFKELDYIDEVITINNIGSTYYNKDHNYIGNVYSMDKNSFDKLDFHIIEGKFPNSENELLINRAFMYEYDLKVGDTFKMPIGDIKESEQYSLYNNEIINDKEIEYKIVGIIDKFDKLITTNSSPKSYDAYIILKEPKNYKTDIIKLLGNGISLDNVESKYDDFDLNLQVIIWETLDFSSQAVQILTTIIGIILFIIIVTSIFAIRNSFAISISEKMKTYGMLSSVGATKKQIRRMVLFEGFVIGVMGIGLGIILGIGVNLLLIFIINTIANNANLFGDGFQLVYKFSFIPIILSIVLSFVVIFLSVITCAIKASKASPIQNIRNSDDIKAKKLRIPKIIRKIFGIGGVLSYKNLKRSKKKYRVTIVSLTISIFIYIIASTFVEYMINVIHEEYSTYNYNVQVSVSTDDREKEKEAIKKLESMGKAYTKYQIVLDSQLDIDNHITYKGIVHDYEEFHDVSYEIVLYNDNGFKEYVDRLNLDYDEVKDKIIVVNEIKNEISSKRNEYIKLTDYKENDSISIENNNLYIAKVTRERPIGLEGYVENEILYFVGNYEHFPKIKDSNMYFEQVYYNSDDSYKLVDNIKDLEIKGVIFNIENLDEEVSQFRSLMLILSIVVYGFIVVVTFIGISSVFNTINSNMELRSKDFATLKSIGMTKKEFNNMINLEAIFYSIKSLLYGIVLGLIGSYSIFYLMSDNYIFEYRAPIKSILIAIVFIVILILIIMRYSIKKINKQNIIETIRNSNI